MTSHLPFAAFIAHLQRLGFTIGVEHYLRLYALLDGMGEHHPRQLKTLLCPIFATGKEQQQQFYAAFDSFFQHWYHAEEKAQAEQEAEQKTTPKPVRTPRWKLWTAVLLWAFLIACVGWRVHQELFPAQPPVVPVQPKKPAQPREEPTAPVASEVVRRPPQILKIEKPEPPPQTWYEKHWNTLRWGVVGFPLFVWLLWEARAWQRRRLAVVRQKGRKPPVSWPLQIIPPQPRFLRSEGFFRLARILHQRLPGEQMRLDIPATVQRSIERLGYAELCYQPVQQVPEYLVLIDLPYGRDHHSHLADSLFKALREEDLHVHRFFYHRNPRICFVEVDGERVFVQDLQARYGACRLLLIGDGDALLDPVSGMAEDWVELFETWQQRALLTPVSPAQWGAREIQLAHEFVILPASLDGLNSILVYFEEQRGESLRERKQRDREDPLPDLPDSGEVSAAQVQALRAWLEKTDSNAASNTIRDNGLFRWVCTCAVYPELHWDLTLYLAGLDCLPDDLLTEDKLLRLLRLPWFRDGHMPDNWRWALLRELNNPTASCVREALIELLEQHPPPKDSAAWDTYHLHLALQRWLFFRLGRKTEGQEPRRWGNPLRRLRDKLKHWRELKQAVAAQPATQDYALLRLLEGTPSPLALLLPQRLRKLFYRHGVPLLGMRSGIRLGIIALLSAGLLWAVPRYEPLPPPTIEKDWIAAKEELNKSPAGTVFRDVLQSGGTGPEMVVVKGSTFKMGDEDNGPIHDVTVGDFYIGRYEVTVGEYLQCVQAGACPEPSWREAGSEYHIDTGTNDYYKKLGEALTAENYPIVGVSWEDAQAYAEWLGRQTGYEYRLPTEAEWEYAARAGTETAYWWGDNASHEYANYGTDECCDSLAQGKDTWFYTSPVGAFPANPFGLYDTAGNVYEWVQDWYGEYPTEAQTNPEGLQEGSDRVLRGGAWNSPPLDVRSAYRDGWLPGSRDNSLGFRLARTDARPFYTSEVEPPRYPSFRDKLKDPNAVAPEMVVLPGGTFQMGSPNSEEGRDSDEGPVHEVTLDEFAIARYEVTFAEYDAFCDATGRDKPDDQGWGRGQRPVINVSWKDAQAYAQWLSEQSGYTYRLPTEAEWEYAARADTKTSRYWGDNPDEACRYENVADETAKEKNPDWTIHNCADEYVNTAPVGQFTANEFGLHDMLGNVWEWVNDWYGEYPATAQTNPVGPNKGSNRVFRGGAWNSPPQNVRSALRVRWNPGARVNLLGFRLARTGPWPFYTSEVEEPEMVVFAEGGSFKMGSEEFDSEKPIHDVTLSPFEIGTYEVTVGEFKRFVEAENYQGQKPDAEFRCKDFMQPDFEQDDSHPVVCITWNDVKAYIVWLNGKTGKDYRLPTEAEWEYAAKGGTQTKYWWGNDIGQNNANCDNSSCGDSFERTAPVGSFKPNPFDLYDTAGNVWEWVEDWYGDYPEEAQTDPKGPDKGSSRVARGGAWVSTPLYVRSARRNGADPGLRDNYLGFRLARTLPLGTFTPPASQSPLKPETEPEYENLGVYMDPLKDKSSGPELVYLSGGTFVMGSPDSEEGRYDDEGPVHDVTLDAFMIGRYEVTVVEYLRCVQAGACREPEWQEKGSQYNIDTGNDEYYKKFGSALTADKSPIVGVSWEDAVSYAQWLSQETGAEYRLPTEAEWEYAARGGKQTAYWWGDDIGQNNANCDNNACGDKFDYIAPVGSFTANPYGLYDTAGNVWEWVQDWYANKYPATAQINPVGPEKGSHRVRRGGAWDSPPRSVRSANRLRTVPGVRDGNLGFRLARTVP